MACTQWRSGNSSFFPRFLAGLCCTGRDVDEDDFDADMEAELAHAGAVPAVHGVSSVCSERLQPIENPTEPRLALRPFCQN
eukprot:5312085-Amphidinium_carterae.1